MDRYMVVVEDNFHHMGSMGEEEQYELGEFDSCEGALAASKRIVDEFLLSSWEAPMSEDELWFLYTTFGDSPIIMTADPECRFSAWEYARQRCKELAQSNR